MCVCITDSCKVYNKTYNSIIIVCGSHAAPAPITPVLIKYLKLNSNETLISSSNFKNRLFIIACLPRPRKKENPAFISVLLGNKSLMGRAVSLSALNILLMQGYLTRTQLNTASKHANFDFAKCIYFYLCN